MDEQSNVEHYIRLSSELSDCGYSEHGRKWNKKNRSPNSYRQSDDVSGSSAKYQAFLV